MGRLSLRFAALGYLTLILIGPLVMMVWRTAEDVDGAWAAISDPDTLSAFKLTLMVTAIAVVVNTVFGIVCALVIVRGDIRGRGFLNAFVDLPLALSPVIVGFSLVTLYGLNGWLGWFVVREVVPTLREIGTEQEQAAETLGASGWQTFWRITLPSVRWAVIYGVVLTAARGIGEFGAVAVVSGNFAGVMQTAKLRVEDAYQFANGKYAPANGISFVLAATAVIILVAMILLQPKESRH